MLIKSIGIDKTRATAINLFFNYGAAVIQIINSIVLIPVYLKFMTLSDYGAWIAGCAIINLFQIIDPGLSSLSSQKLSKGFANDNDDEFQATLKSSLILSMIFSLVILSITLPLIKFLPGIINYSESNISKQLPEAFLLFVFAIFIVPISSVLSSMLQALLRTFEDNSVNFISILCSPIIILVALFNDYGISSLALGILIPNIIRFFGLLTLCIYFYFKYFGNTLSKLFSSRNIFLMGDLKFLYLRRFSTLTSENIEYLLSGIFINTEVAASISIVKRLFISVQLFSVSIGTSAYTSLSHKFSKSTAGGLKEVIGKTIYSFQLIHVSGTVLVLASISPILSLWLDSELLFSYFVILLFAITVFLNAKVSLFSSILYSAGTFNKVAYIGLVESGVRIALSLMLLSWLEVPGLLVAGIVSAALSIILQSSIIGDLLNEMREKLLFMFSKYEAIVFLFALIFGFYHQSLSTTVLLIFQILVCSLIIMILILISDRSRRLITEIFSRFTQRDDKYRK